MSAMALTLRKLPDLRNPHASADSQEMWLMLKLPEPMDRTGPIPRATLVEVISLAERVIR
jgi:hypothetical protein